MSFLDKYLSKDKKKRKKPKDGKSKKFKGGGLRIVDEDGFGLHDQKIDTSDDETAEELPQIAALVDERPREAQLLDEIKQGKWKQLETVDSSRSRSKGQIRRHDSDSSDDDRDGNERSSIVQEARRRHDSSDSDDVSPPRRRRHDSDNDGDLSPPRQRRRHDSDNDISPPRQRKRHDSDNDDISPPRQRRRHDSGDLSPPRPKKRHDSGDLSPPRRPSSHHDRQSSGRRRQDDDDLSPPRHSARRGSPPGRFNNRNRQQSHQSNNSRRAIVNPEIIEESRSGTTLDGKRAGLQRASDLRKEMVDYRKRENEMFSNLDDEVSGRNAETKLRDRTTGRERDLAAEMAKKEEEDRVAAEKKMLYAKWGKGLKQVEEYSTKLNEALHEVSKPLARYSNDKDLDEHLKHQERDGDPMLKFLTSKKRGGGSSGKPMYQGPPPLPNRFAIPPGHRWDGVDRSGGYEKEWFSRINARKALEEEAYKWSVEDL